VVVGKRGLQGGGRKERTVRWWKEREDCKVVEGKRGLQGGGRKERTVAKMFYIFIKHFSFSSTKNVCRKKRNSAKIEKPVSNSNMKNP
jgi:hypothetical protein